MWQNHYHNRVHAAVIHHLLEAPLLVDEASPVVAHKQAAELTHKAQAFSDDERTRFPLVRASASIVASPMLTHTRLYCIVVPGDSRLCS